MDAIPMYASGYCSSWVSRCYSAPGRVSPSPSSCFILGIAWPAVREERVLRAELTGYGDYAASVRYRFIPFVW
jgi:protein-S-isoprenylcysteine O-methyltransferase Ste14